MFLFFCSCKENRVPLNIIVKKVSLTAYPALTPWGSAWDSDGTGPDISFLMLNSSNQDLIGYGTKDNVSSFNPASWPFNKKMSPPNTYSLAFYEDDGGTSSITMVTFYFNYKVGDDYPNPIRSSANGYTVELEVEYEF